MKDIKIYLGSLSRASTEISSILSHAIEVLNSEYKNEFRIEFRTWQDFPSHRYGETDGLTKIKYADIVIFVLTENSDETMYEIGVTDALNKPYILLIDNKLDTPFEYWNHDFISFDSSTLSTPTFKSKLIDNIKDAIVSPIKWTYDKVKSKETKKLKTVFISYSHKDFQQLERLKVHFKPLERMGAIQLWSDTLIQGGEKWKEEIEKGLEKAAIAILLISADFLASDFIVNNELQPLLKMAETKGTIIIPMVLKPCRFLREPSLSQFQSINNPTKPLVSLTDYEQEEIYEMLSKRVELSLNSK